MSQLFRPGRDKCTKFFCLMKNSKSLAWLCSPAALNRAFFIILHRNSYQKSLNLGLKACLQSVYCLTNSHHASLNQTCSSSQPICGFYSCYWYCFSGFPTSDKCKKCGINVVQSVHFLMKKFAVSASFLRNNIRIITNVILRLFINHQTGIFC
jgi:hypothetical protein